MVEVYPIGSIGILKMSMMKSDEELCERKANIDGMDQGWNLIKVKYVGITLGVAAAVSIADHCDHFSACIIKLQKPMSKIFRNFTEV